MKICRLYFKAHSGRAFTISILSVASLAVCRVNFLPLFSCSGVYSQRASHSICPGRDSPSGFLSKTLFTKTHEYEKRYSRSEASRMHSLQKNLWRVLIVINCCHQLSPVHVNRSFFLVVGVFCVVEIANAM